MRGKAAGRTKALIQKKHPSHKQAGTREDRGEAEQALLNASITQLRKHPNGMISGGSNRSRIYSQKSAGGRTLEQLRTRVRRASTNARTKKSTLPIDAVATETTATKTTPGRYVALKGLAIRQYKDIKSLKKGNVSRGDSFKVEEGDGKRARIIKDNGTTGWVSIISSTTGETLIKQTRRRLAATDTFAELACLTQRLADGNLANLEAQDESTMLPAQRFMHRRRLADATRMAAKDVYSMSTPQLATHRRRLKYGVNVSDVLAALMEDVEDLQRNN